MIIGTQITKGPQAASRPGAGVSLSAVLPALRAVAVMLATRAPQWVTLEREEQPRSPQAPGSAS